MKHKKLSALALALVLVLALAGCGEKKDPTPPAEPPAEPPKTEAVDVAASVKSLQAEKAEPSAYLQLAEKLTADTSKEDAKLLADALLASQEAYLASVVAAYEGANANAEFADLYAGDITPDLAEKITDQSIKELVANTYANGMKLVKSEGYVYPHIDLVAYEGSLFPAMNETDVDAMQKSIENVNTLQ